MFKIREFIKFGQIPEQNYFIVIMGDKSICGK